MDIPCARLIRLETSSLHGTFGALLIQGQVFCATLEPVLYFNRPFVSCIPAGQYVCKRVVSPRFGTTFEITNVPDRDKILFHPGNLDDDTEGCVILGQYWGKLAGDRAVLNSGATFRDFMSRMAGKNKMRLTVKEHF